jgi:HK97 family phage prohead protease
MMHKGLATTVLRKGGDTASCMVSTEGVDRDGDRLFAAGADLGQYRRNPVVLFAHDSRSIPVGRAISVEATPGQGLRATWQWNTGDELGRRVKAAWEGGFLSATSVGFKPREYEKNRFGGLDFTDWELLEFSVVPIPANPGAVRGLKSLGLSPRLFDDDAELVLVDDRGREIELDRSESFAVDLGGGRVLSVTREELRELAGDVARQLVADVARAVRRSLH